MTKICLFEIKKSRVCGGELVDLSMRELLSPRISMEPSSNYSLSLLIFLSSKDVFFVCKVASS